LEGIAMKVKCIEKPYEYYPITVGKTYHVIEEDQSFYKVTNDKGEIEGFYKSRFRVMEDSEPKHETEITYKHFLSSMPASARACVMIGAEGQTVSAYDMEFDCDTEVLSRKFSVL
jgi:hypothetical protein